MRTRCRPILTAVLVLSTLFDLLISIVLFVRPEIEAAQFGVAMNPDTLFLAQVIGGLTLFFTAICGWTAWQLQRRGPEPTIILMFISVFLICTGIGLWLHFGQERYLLTDTLRGCLILGLYLARAD